MSLTSRPAATCCAEARETRLPSPSSASGFRCGAAAAGAPPSCSRDPLPARAARDTHAQGILAAQAHNSARRCAARREAGHAEAVCTHAARASRELRRVALQLRDAARERRSRSWRKARGPATMARSATTRTRRVVLRVAHEDAAHATPRFPSRLPSPRRRHVCEPEADYAQMQKHQTKACILAGRI
jgi:hypothetical protein